MTEKIRPLPNPIVEPDGSLVVHSVSTPESFDIRGGASIGSHRVIPVLFVPGIMGTNLRVRGDVKLPEGYPLKAGDPAWRPPNSKAGGLWESRKWAIRNPAERQVILNPNFVEVDGTGDLDSSAGSSLKPEVMRERGWGEIYTGSYGTLLADLQEHLDSTFRVRIGGKREVLEHWKSVMQCDPWTQWGVRGMARLTEQELEKYAGYQYPVYAVGYNWLQCCGYSAQRVEKRIREIIKWWQARRYDCKQVILVSHSMGGLVARAAAKRVPDLVAGVIHGVMPAFGAPVAYRRIACGTESDSPSASAMDNFKAARFAEIAGETTDETTPVMAASAGVMELLPNQYYPRPWLHVRVMRPVDKKKWAYDYLHLPAEENPYDFYRDTKAWYRLINPTLADPKRMYARKHGGVETMVGDALKSAELFHRELADYYHPQTFAFYGSDKNHLSYGQIRWVAQEEKASTAIPLTWANVQKAKFVEHAEDGSRIVEVEGKYRLRFAPEPQDAPGDDTVPQQSGAGPAKHVTLVFPTHGYGHQESFQDGNMILLTRHLIVKIVQSLK
jgi:pimeloyl-ACP methyl ester carboxylesterase